MASHARDAIPERTTPSARTARSRDKRAAIIAAAKSVFFQEGYAGASMDRITAVAGVSKATVYNHFRSKEELLQAVVEDVILPFMEDYRTTLDREAPFLDWLTELALSIARKATHPETVALTRLMIGESLRFPALGRMFLATAVEAALQMYIPKFTEAIDRGILRQGNVHEMVQHFVEACSSGPQRNLLFRAPRPITPDEITAHAREAVRFFLEGYGCRA